ncbi:MAG: GIY-YIG nuclease family protein [Anaerolineales bacterium]|nr:GIY-YIG nuclease family protein [Anaerolineales bacterium]
MTLLNAYDTGFDISLVITMYDAWSTPHTTTRTLFLRNLDGITLDQKIENARTLLRELSNEINYITGVGVDKGVIKSDGKKVAEEVFQLEPHKDFKYFYHSININFSSVSTYMWVKENKRLWHIPETEKDNGWERKLIQRPAKSVTLSLPCFVPVSQNQKTIGTFLSYVATTKRRRRVTGWIVGYNRNDPIFLSFINKFLPDGFISLGSHHHFGTDAKFIHISGSFVPARKKKPLKGPRKTYLASQPSDNTDYVYIIQMGRKNIFKIGKSNDPNSRLASLQTANPYKLKFLNIFSADNASAAEETLHTALYENKLEGEWFRLTNTEKNALASVSKFQDGKFIVRKKKYTIQELLNL